MSDEAIWAACFPIDNQSRPRAQLTRRAFGFHSPEALIALAMLSLADLCPPLPR
jgi:hypothetical protein